MTAVTLTPSNDTSIIIDDYNAPDSMGVELPTPTHVEYRQVLVVVAHLMGGLLEHDEHKSGPKYFCEGTLKIPY